MVIFDQVVVFDKMVISDQVVLLSTLTLNLHFLIGTEVGALFLIGKDRRILALIHARALSKNKAPTLVQKDNKIYD